MRRRTAAAGGGRLPSSSRKGFRESLFRQCFLGIFFPKWPVFRERDGLLFCPCPPRPPRARFRRSGNLRWAQLGVGSPHVTLGGRTGFSFAENFLFCLSSCFLQFPLFWFGFLTALVWCTIYHLFLKSCPFWFFSFFPPSLVFYFSTKIEFFASVVPKGKRPVFYLRAEYACARVSGSAFFDFVVKASVFSLIVSHILQKGAQIRKVKNAECLSHAEKTTFFLTSNHR